MVGTFSDVESGTDTVGSAMIVDGSGTGSTGAAAANAVRKMSVAASRMVRLGMAGWLADTLTGRWTDRWVGGRRGLRRGLRRWDGWDGTVRCKVAAGRQVDGCPGRFLMTDG